MECAPDFQPNCDAMLTLGMAGELLSELGVGALGRPGCLEATRQQSIAYYHSDPWKFSVDHHWGSMTGR